MLRESPLLLTLMRRVALVAVLLAFGVVVLGAYVRLTTAGLGCPDWPGCYGHATPTAAAADVGKAWREMIHRYLAGSLVVLTLVLAVLAFMRRHARNSGGASLAFVLAVVATIFIQALLGMLTVTWQVAPQIVTLHLLFGMTTLGLLWWLWLNLDARVPRTAVPELGRSPGVRWAPSHRLSGRLALLGLVALGLQIALGGWTSTNYAAIACPDFPTCQASWWPHMDFGSAFVLWHAPTVNYEGGVLGNPARIAIHFTHRLGALVATLALLLAAGWTLRETALARARPAAIAVLAALLLQLTIGISMVLKGFPLWLATAHNGGAALLLLATLALNHRLLAAGQRA
ncbi:MAG TPA: COX15/CtaA family protein [Steroidobacteraceae bacterium]|jgi:cytochrome c oxidase assembly protein subunit 15|nr:COX15/CtaA family protein [Steroidobacteraceae bacterium]